MKESASGSVSQQARDISTAEYCIARRPIFDRDLGLSAYELRFRDATTGEASPDPGEAVAEVLATSTDVSLATLVGPQLAFIEFPERYLDEPELVNLPPSKVVPQVRSDLDLSPDRILGARRLVDRGFTLALNDYTGDPQVEAILPLTRIVEVDIRAVAPEDREALIQRLAGRGLRVLAKNVDTHADFETLRDLGCDLFQGYFFVRPRIIPGRGLPASHLALIELLARINDPAADIDSLSELVSRDVALSARVLKHVNSAASALTREVDSIREAVVYLGRNPVRNLAALILMARVDRKPRELMIMALVRAKACELTARERGDRNADSYFTAGLFSVLDGLMDAPMEEILEVLGVSDDMKLALAQHAGEIGRVLDAILQLERGDLCALDDDETLPLRDLAEVYQSALGWADEVAVETGLA